MEKQNAPKTIEKIEYIDVEDLSEILTDDEDNKNETR